MLDATRLLRLYARYRLTQLARMKSVDVQERQLMSLVRRAAHTRFGRDHGFGGIKSVADYQVTVPLRRYEDFWTQYWRPKFPVLDDVTWPGRIPYFAKSSGTSTGATKFIPVSRPMIGSNQRAVFDLLTHHIAHKPQSRVLGGKNFMLGGSTELTLLAPGVMAGDLSGIAAREVPRWAHSRYFPPPDLALISDWEEKAARLAARSLDEDIRTFGGTPSWLLVFIDHLRVLRPGSSGRLIDYYPKLELLVHGGVNFAPYRRRFDALLQGSRAELREVYPASEGFIAMADRRPGEGLRLVLDNGLFFEFVPTDELASAKPVRHWIANVQTGVDYAVVISTCAGLWSYIVGDTIRFVSLDPPRIVVTGRTSYGLSAFGEHLIGEQIEEAIAAAAASIGTSVDDFSVGPIYPEEPDRPGHHLFVVEFSTAMSPEALDTFRRELDRKLSDASEDYAAHRAGDFGMGPPEILQVPPGTFAIWMKSRGKLGGQNKVPRVILDSTLLDSLVSAGGRPSA
ncbi:MAG TPA: GH3 auxin-responsive promoter family protein [Alphaproteobacteria bacterium]|nr:GH3 auxin-responsive promoter family protein [Alphaproteobacteria bacterium]